MKRKYEVVFGPKVGLPCGGIGPFWVEIKTSVSGFPIGVWFRSGPYGEFRPPTEQDKDFVAALMEVSPEIIQRAHLGKMSEGYMWCLTVEIPSTQPRLDYLVHYMRGKGK